MFRKYRDKLHKINCLTNELNALYHRAALKLDMSDSGMTVMYMLADKGGNYPLHNICIESGVSKQTVNSAIRNLEEKGLIYLEKTKGKNKQVFLTPEGENYSDKTVKRLIAAECAVFKNWSEEETDLYIKLTEKYCNSLKKQIEIM